MITECNNLRIINKFLDNFNTNITDISVFQKFLIFKLNNKDVGFVDYSLIYDRLEINYIYVIKDYRNNNIATKLIDYLIKNNNCSSISLEVNESNVNAIQFYKKNKFNEVTRRKNYYGSNDALLMIRELM